MSFYRSGSLLFGMTLLMVVGCTGAGDEGGDATARTTPGVSRDTIYVGALVPLSDAVALIGTPLAAGQRVYFQQLNARGGVAGRYKVHLLLEDVTYSNPSTSVQKYNKLRDRVALFSMILGTDHVNVTLPLLDEDNMLAVPTTMDAEWVREEHLISVLAPYQIQMINGAAYYVEQEGRGDTMCVLAMSSGYGQAAEEGVAFAAKELGFPVAATARLRPGDQDFVAQVTQLRNARCDAVFLASLPSETGKIFATAAQLSFTPRWILTSPSWHVVLGQSPIGGYASRHVWIVSEGVEWGDTTVAGMAELLDAVRQHAPNQKPDFYFVAGYTMARSVHAVLERAAEAGDLSREGLAKGLVALDTVGFGGLMGTYRYGPIARREPPRENTVFAVDPARPGGVSVVARDFGSPIARSFQFTAQKR